jgi:protein-disulfide isomerase
MEDEVLTPADQDQPEDENTITFKRSHLYAALLPLAFVLGLSVGYLFWGRTPSQPAAPVAAQPEGQAAVTAEEQTFKRYDVPVDDDPVLGAADAPITLIEFSDFECPYCRQWHEQVFGRLKQEYASQVRFVYRDFPLIGVHANAESAALAANCANEQGVFWDYHDRLFQATAGLGTAAYLQYARELNLDVDQFQTCLDTAKYEQEVQGDYNYAANLGIRSTPTFFINGIPLVGAQPYEVFKQVIDKELAGELPK